MARTHVYRPRAPQGPEAHAPAATAIRTDTAAADVDCHPDHTIVTKRIKPGQAGTKSALAEHGTRLVCVRYRDDREQGQRFTTVELVIDQRPMRRQPLVRVHIAFDDAATRRRAQSLGAVWDAQEKTWRMPRAAAIQMGLLSNRRPRRKAK